MKKTIAITLALVLTFALIGTSALAAPADSKVIGVILSDYTHEFFLAIDAGIKEVLEPEGYTIVGLNSSNDAAKDVTNMEDLIAQDPACIFLNPVDSDAAEDVVKMANVAGIPVITVDRAANGGEVATHIASDNIYGGELAGQYIIDLLGEDGGQVVEIQGQAGASATNDRGQGFHNAVDGNDKIEVVISQTGNWSTAESMTVMENALTAFPDVKAVFAHNDPEAYGALEACKQAGREDIIVVGFNGDSEAIEFIKSGEMDATVEQLPHQMGVDAANAFLALSAGEELDDFIGVKVALVTAETLAEAK